MCDQDQNCDTDTPDEYFPTSSSGSCSPVKRAIGDDYDCVFLYNQISEAILLFDKLFYDISPTRKYNVFPRSPSIEISRQLLSDIQCNAISRLSGSLFNLHTIFENAKLQKKLQATILAETDLKFPMNITTIENARVATQQCAMLKQYLTLELARSEKLDHANKQLETDMVSIVEEKVKLIQELNEWKAKAERMKNTTTSSSSSSSSVLVTKSHPPRINNSAPKQQTNLSQNTTTTISGNNSIDPATLMGKYVRKEFYGVGKFFGLIVQYFEPFYRIMYEDADIEDSDIAEVLPILWKEKVPQVKQQACRKFAQQENLDPDNPTIRYGCSDEWEAATPAPTATVATEMKNEPTTTASATATLTAAATVSSTVKSVVKPMVVTTSSSSSNSNSNSNRLKKNGTAVKKGPNHNQNNAPRKMTSISFPVNNGTIDTTAIAATPSSTVSSSSSSSLFSNTSATSSSPSLASIASRPTANTITAINTTNPSVKPPSSSFSLSTLSYATAVKTPTNSNTAVKISNPSPTTTYPPIRKGRIVNPHFPRESWDSVRNIPLESQPPTANRLSLEGEQVVSSTLTTSSSSSSSYAVIPPLMAACEVSIARSMVNSSGSNNGNNDQQHQHQPKRKALSDDVEFDEQSSSSSTPVMIKKPRMSQETIVIDLC